VAGWTTGRPDYVTLAYDASRGARLWGTRVVRPGDTNQAYSVAVSPDGSKVFTTGISYRVGRAVLMTVAIHAANGVKLWVARSGTEVGVGYHSFRGSTEVSPSPDGSRVFVIGSARSHGGTFAFLTVSYDAATGRRLWTRCFGGKNGRDAFDLAVSPDGSKVFVTGGTANPGGGAHFATVAYDAATGTHVWVARSEGVNDWAYAVAITPDGSRVLVTGTSYGGPQTYDDYLTAAYDSATGAMLWEARFSGSSRNSEYATDIAVTPDGSRVFVTGASLPAYGTVAYTP
jgi:WD40 repeat protein